MKDTAQPLDEEVDVAEMDAAIEGMFLGMDKLEMLVGDEVEIGLGPRLVYIWGQRRHQMPITRSLTVGRSAACDILVPATVISRRHFQLTPTSQGLLLHVLGATNRCTVNGKPVDKSVTLTCGDLIETCGIYFLYVE